MDELEGLLRGCVGIVSEAGNIIREAWNRPRNIRFKGATDLVTETDVAVESFLVERLGRLLPGSEFLAEEGHAGAAPTGSNCWIIDPVDGTTNFVHHIPQVGISVGLWRGGEVVLGVIGVPMLDECYWARKGGGAFLSGKPVAVSSEDRLVGALVGTGFPCDSDGQIGALTGRMGRVLPATQGVRRIGAASVDLAYVACGRLDAFYEAGLKPWDMAAGCLLVEEAGGRVSDMDGGPMRLGAPVLATNGRLHDAMTALLREPAWSKSS
ncbi:MAG: inositol monophosphatase [Desulfovibrio sp.]|nr:inositol monophosphatase [Desulfovibrio sp.]